MVYKQAYTTLRESIMDISFYALVSLILLMIYQLMSNLWK